MSACLLGRPPHIRDDRINLGEKTSLRLQMVDACVIACAKRLDVREVATLDRRDFLVMAPGAERGPPGTARGAGRNRRMEGWPVPAKGQSVQAKVLAWQPSPGKISTRSHSGLPCSSPTIRSMTLISRKESSGAASDLAAASKSHSPAHKRL
jgi:hypothetical protein